MLIELLLNLADYIITPLLDIIGAIFNTLNVNEIIEPIGDGLNLLFENIGSLMWLVCDLVYLRKILGLVLTIETTFTIYRITMWALKKIPKMSIQE